jgi:hypothetical protein
MGDTNSRYTRVLDNIRVLSSQNSLTDPWVALEHAGSIPTVETLCDNPSLIDTCETVDKVFFRGSNIINLSATDFSYASSKFLQADGNVLSDHNPISVVFSWSLSATRRQSNFWGGPGGTWFNDITALPASPKASIISFHGGSRLDSIGLTLTSGASFFHGGTGGTAASLTLASNEYWTSVNVCQGVYNSSTRLFYIKATTSLGKTLASGTSTSDCTTFTAPTGWQIVGYSGQAGDTIDQLSFIYAPQ